MLVGGKTIHGTERPKPKCVTKKCKKVPTFIFFVDDIGFIEACPTHKNVAVMEIVNQILTFNFKSTKSSN